MNAISVSLRLDAFAVVCAFTFIAAIVLGAF
jgi:hypothetical protein